MLLFFIEKYKAAILLNRIAITCNRDFVKYKNQTDLHSAHFSFESGCKDFIRIEG